ncbi:beta-lactamase class C [Hyphomonas oceanitis SCH89]|uniref:Beta-lactamase class C n=2 Tax=Hyphomonas oceanitis TaxID=81033 RepID=A0A059G7K7_9PROT|nr:beta-lactamase class C [Hyphomonas oceanitis SCH89]
MKRVLGIILAVMVALGLWATVVVVGAREGWWRPMVAERGDAEAFLLWAEGRYAAESEGNMAIVLLEGGQASGSWFASQGRPVNAESLFQVASVSKWLTAWGVMTLVEDGRVDLDAPVSRYLTRWTLPPGAFDNDQVTVRRLLSHSAGLTDGLGFLGFGPDVDLPSIVDELTDPVDAYPGRSGVVRVGARADGTWRYSGGGYLVLQLVIEEVSGEAFNDYMRRAVFSPLGMSASTFVDPDPEHLAEIYAADGSEAVHYRFTATGAASLYTSVADMTRFLEAQVATPGAAPGCGVLSPETLAAMAAPEAFVYSLPVWGLGESLYAPNGAGGFVIGHDGSNFPAINTTARLDPATGNGLIVLSSGHATLASEIGGEWVHWQTGKVGLDTIVLFDLRRILIVFASGALVIIAGGVAFIWFGRRRAGAT